MIMLTTNLPGEYNVSATFNVADLSPCVDAGTDSRTNPFEAKGNDENQATSTTKDFIQGPITRARAKSLQNLICEIIRSKDYKLEWHEEKCKGLNLVKIMLRSDQVSCGALDYME